METLRSQVRVLHTAHTAISAYGANTCESKLVLMLALVSTLNQSVPSNLWLVCPDHMKKQSDYCNIGLVEDSVKEPVN